MEPDAEHEEGDKMLSKAFDTGAAASLAGDLDEELNRTFLRVLLNLTVLSHQVGTTNLS